MASNFDTNTNSESPSGSDSTSIQSDYGGENLSEGELNNQDKRVKVEEALTHLPEELRHLLMKYRAFDVEMKDEVKFLQPLAEFYQQQYEAQPDLWMSGLRAHGLWVACSLRDPEKSDYIQSAFKLMNSRLSTDQLSELNTENKEVLIQYRETHRTRTSEVKSLLSNIDSNDWSNNLDFMTDFTSAVKDLSDYITKDVKDFFSSLIDQSVESLGSAPPCGMAVIAIGSLARSETTSFSDIEYMFLIEEDSDSSVQYFRQLAFQTYYFLSLLGESHLRYTYDVQELNAVGFADRCTKGLRIDGLSKKAGNQPTGNEVEGSQLMFTSKQLLVHYQGILLEQIIGPEKGVPSDFVDMISHRILVWSTGNGDEIYKTLEDRLNNISHSQERKNKSLGLLLTDMEEYSFLPNLDNMHTGHQEVKWDLYRYPSLLLAGLNNSLAIKSITNWATVDNLVKRGNCPEETGVALCFLLASAIFIRVDCYNFYQQQNDQVTLFIGEENSPQYSCPQNLFILMTSYLFPVKSLTMAELKRNSGEVVMRSFKQDTFQAICITYFYCGAYDKVISQFTGKYGEETMFDQVHEFAHKVPQDQLETLLSSLYASNSLAERHIKLLETANVFHVPIDKLMAMCYMRTNPAKALFYAQEQQSKTSSDDRESIFNAYLQLSQCHQQMRDYNRCEDMLKAARACLDDIMVNYQYTQADAFRLKMTLLDFRAALSYQQNNYDVYLRLSRQKLDICEKFYGPGVIHKNVRASLGNIGLAYSHLKQYSESLEYYNRGLYMDYKLYGSTSDNRVIAIALMNIGFLKGDMREFEQAVDYLTRSYEMMCRLYSNITPTHPDITQCVGHIAFCHYSMSDYIKALQCYTKVRTNLTEVSFVDTKLLAFCNNRMGLCHVKLDDYKSAVESFSESLKLYRVINEDGKYDSQVSRECCGIASCHYHMSDYTEALQWYREEYKELTGANVVDKEKLVICTENIGMCHKHLEDYKSAVESFTESLKFYREINQDVKYDSKVARKYSVLALCQYAMSNYTAALQWYKELYTSLTRANVIDKEKLAICIDNMGSCHENLKDHQSAVESFTESLIVYREINQNGKYDRDIREGMTQIEDCKSKLIPKAAK